MSSKVRAFPKRRMVLHSKRRIIKAQPHASLWRCLLFPVSQYGQCLFATRTAHGRLRPQAAAHRWAAGLAKDLAAPISRQLHTGHARRFAARHTRNGAADRRRNAAGAAAGTAIHKAAKPCKISRTRACLGLKSGQQINASAGGTVTVPKHWLARTTCTPWHCACCKACFKS